MKHLYSLSLLLLALLLPATALAHDFEVDGIYYNINGNEATVTYKGAFPDEYDEYSGSVTIPSSVIYNGTTYSVTTIGGSAFYACSGLTTVTIPNSVTSIGNSAFSSCTVLTSISIPNSVTTISDNTFQACSGLTSIEIPSSVTSIGDNAFILCNSLTSIVIPNSVTTIGNYAFSSCSSLTSITIGDSVTIIGEDAFEGCTGLTSVNITDIDSWCEIEFKDFQANPLLFAHHLFLNGTEVTNLIIPNSVTSIGDYAFLECSNLNSINIGNSVTSIGNYAFLACTSLTNATIGNSVISIGDDAFLACTSLTSVTIGSFVTSIGAYAFEECTSLINIDIPNSVTSIGCGAFSYCSSLTSASIGNSVTYISDNAFYECTGLTGIDIPNSVTSIGNSAFYNCSGLTSINIGNSVAHIGDHAFTCSNKNLINIQVASGNPKYDSRNSCNAIIETASNTLILGCMNTVIPNSVTSIGDWAFYNCSNLTSITIPNSVTSIGNYAFDGCSNLVEIYSLALMPPTIDSNTFNSCYGSTLYVPKEAVNAYRTANYWKKFTNIVGFVECVGVFEVDGILYRAMNDGTATVIANEEMENYYVGDKMIAETVVFEGNNYVVTFIEDNAFSDCYELTSVVIPNSIETIGEQAFQGCTGLTSVTIGSGVTAIGTKAFNYCNALEIVKCLGTVPPVMASTDCFSTAAYNRATLLVPRQQIETYQAADYWYKFAHIDGWGSAGRGDIDGDGVVSIRDVTRMIDAILTGEHEGVYFESADLNLNGRLDIGDVTSIIDMLLTDNR